MKPHQLAAQLYTVREYCKTPADIAASLKKIRDIGYPAVQLSGLGPIAEDELVRICRDLGLTICATHEPSARILDEPHAIAERLKKLGCRYTAYPYPAGVDFGSLASVRDLAAKLNHAGKVLHDAGCVLCYHNHHMEFRRFNGKTALEIIFAETDPRYLQAEIDTYWVQYGGGNPVTWCQRLAGRLPLIHLKDFAINDQNQITFAEIGHGNLDWPAILRAADLAGCQWFIVEQDTCPGDPFESLATSLRYIRQHLLTP
ncbi:MAG: sugar phosphate isomerase/epimerase [Verrucomicrobiae bacterium]|nr:sugar phosphate isomerase/epimerase [Verrucomicrobiae bacterium]